MKIDNIKIKIKAKGGKRLILPQIIERKKMMRKKQIKRNEFGWKIQVNHLLI